eukprot:snap_masked-scaffold1702_size30647-processed-gene-0.9 protein:Tk01987 transcript:snap_masked-scaffold1702_size30647-processed-gene-0.9-mRNA-1 annotation:"cdgsh iron sulfur domain-containing protein mitochondrial"
MSVVWGVSGCSWRRWLSSSGPCAAKRWTKRTKVPFQSQLRNPVDEVYGFKVPQAKGHIYDKKPFLVSVKKYQTYTWCGCGLSNQQPFCDDSHRNRYTQKLVRGGPVTYIAPRDQDVWFCQCKQTKHRPFCDGTHREDDIQEARLDGKNDIFNPKVGGSA